MSEAVVSASPNKLQPGQAPLLSARGISKRYGQAWVLRDLSLELHPGEVHGVVGANGSGKSTLIKIFSGAVAPDAGLVEHGKPSIDGRPAPHVGVVHQDLALVGSLTVAENLVQGTHAEIGRWLLPDRRLLRWARHVLDQYGIEVEPDAVVQSCRREIQVQIAVARAHRIATSTGASSGVLILDEATAALPSAGARRVYDLVHRLARAGGAVMLVAHDLDEVTSECHQVSVLRDGKVVTTSPASEVSHDSLFADMFDVPATTGPPEADQAGTYELDSVRHAIARRHASDLDSAAPPNVLTVTGVVGGPLAMRADDSWTVAAGQVVGLAGLPRSGAQEVLAALVGAIRAECGQLTMGAETKSLSAMTMRDALKMGLHFLPSDRARRGGVSAATVWENYAVPFLAGRDAVVLSERRTARRVRDALRPYRVVPDTVDIDFGRLSGGNQQKVLVAKWADHQPRALLLDSPTEGVDAHNRRNIWSMIRLSAERGAAITVFSNDHEELLALCDRVIVYAGGRVSASLTGSKLTKPAIDRACFGALQAVSEPFSGSATATDIRLDRMLDEESQ